MDCEPLREEFEAWMSRRFPSVSLGRWVDCYQDIWVEDMWSAWRASRKSVSVVLPPRSEGRFDAQAVIVALQAAGLRVGSRRAASGRPAARLLSPADSPANIRS